MAPNFVEKIADALNLPGAHKCGDEVEGTTNGPIFEKDKVTVIFVLGGPGAGVSPLFSSPPPTRRSSSSSSMLLI